MDDTSEFRIIGEEEITIDNNNNNEMISREQACSPSESFFEPYRPPKDISRGSLHEKVSRNIQYTNVEKV